VNVFTQNRALGQQSVTDNWRQMCFSTARVMECVWGSDRVDVRGYQRLWVWGRFPPNRRFVSTVCQRVWDIVSLRESRPSGHTQPHNHFWRAQRKAGHWPCYLSRRDTSFMGPGIHRHFKRV